MQGTEHDDCIIHITQMNPFSLYMCMHMYSQDSWILASLLIPRRWINYLSETLQLQTAVGVVRSLALWWDQHASTDLVSFQLAHSITCTDIIIETFATANIHCSAKEFMLFLFLMRPHTASDSCTHVYAVSDPAGEADSATCIYLCARCSGAAW